MRNGWETDKRRDKETERIVRCTNAENLVWKINEKWMRNGWVSMYVCLHVYVYVYVLLLLLSSLYWYVCRVIRVIGVIRVTALVNFSCFFYLVYIGVYLLVQSLAAYVNACMCMYMDNMCVRNT